MNATTVDVPHILFLNLFGDVWLTNNGRWFTKKEWDNNVESEAKFSFMKRESPCITLVLILLKSQISSGRYSSNPPNNA